MGKDWNGALEAFNKAKDNAERLGHGGSESAVGLWLNIGHSKKGLKDFDGAKEAYEKAQLICEKIGLTNSEVGCRVRDSLGKGKSRGRGDSKGGNQKGQKRWKRRWKVQSWQLE